MKSISELRALPPREQLAEIHSLSDAELSSLARIQSESAEASFNNGWLNRTILGHLAARFESRVFNA